MNVSIYACLTAALLLVAPAYAGPSDPSNFDTSAYAAQKVVYDFNFAKPADLQTGLNNVRFHLRTLKEYGAAPGSHIVVVAHGNEIHALARPNREAYPGIYESLRELAAMGAEVHVCNGAARSLGYRTDEFYDLVTVVPAGPTDLARLQGEGYRYIAFNPQPRMGRDEAGTH
jgi:intracellular sulfur oxidation DsrE/DsrF family protein